MCKKWTLFHVNEVDTYTMWKKLTLMPCKRIGLLYHVKTIMTFIPWKRMNTYIMWKKWTLMPCEVNGHLYNRKEMDTYAMRKKWTLLSCMGKKWTLISWERNRSYVMRKKWILMQSTDTYVICKKLTHVTCERNLLLCHANKTESYIVWKK